MIKHLVLDLETNSFNPEDAEVRIFGLYDMDNDKYYITSDKDKAFSIINNSEFIISYNGKLYDMPILERLYGYKPPYDKHIDLYYIFQKRQSVITSKPFSNFKLKTIVNELGLDDEGGKGEIDYSIFKKRPNEWTPEEREDIIKYTKQDLLLTAKCWKFLQEKFEPFKEFISEEDVKNYKHINTSMGSYTYKVISRQIGMKEEYDFNNKHQDYQGAYVKIPTKEFVRGKILCFDFSSLYPQMYVHANLFSYKCDCCSPEERWSGGDFFKTNGSYCMKKQGRIEELIKKFYLMRKEFKRKNDQREQVVKIIINSLYGISGSPIFVNLYNYDTARDCTFLGQQCIKYSIAEFERAGFQALYSDTDSVYVEIPEGKIEEECIRLAKTISSTLSNHFPFPWQEFNLKLESKIKFITFFREEGSDFKKKHYLYVKEDGTLIIKGLALIKKDCSKLSRLIFSKYIKDDIINELRCKYDKKEITRWIYSELMNDRQIAAKQFSIKNKSDYKNNTSIQAMVYDKYGSGQHNLIKNRRIGVGKGVKYCTLEESRKLSLTDFDIDIFLRELSPFIRQEQQNKLF